MAITGGWKKWDEKRSESCAIFDQNSERQSCPIFQYYFSNPPVGRGCLLFELCTDPDHRGLEKLGLEKWDNLNFPNSVGKWDNIQTIFQPRCNSNTTIPL